MANNGFSTVISVIPKDNTFCFYSAVGRDENSFKYQVKNYKARFFDEEFFVEFAKCLREYATANPSYAGKSAFVTVLLPNSLISMTSLNIPGINKKNTSDLFNVAIEGTYPNLKELKMNKLVVKQNKQYSTIAISLIRQKLVQDIYTACSSCNMFANVLSTKAAGTANAALALNPRLKNGTFLITDIKESSAQICFVSKGLMLGSIDIPFGWDILTKQKPVAENMLFEHDVAELAVINAQEKAKAKQLTMMSGGGDAARQAAEDSLDSENENEEGAFNTANSPERQILTIKTLPKKTPRILPKWMQRPIPETQEGVAYENFRIFMKYILEFIRCNSRLTSIAQPECVYVNMPQEFNYLLDNANEEEAENKIKFVSLGLEKEKPIVREHLELYGGLVASQFGSINNF